MKKVSFKSKRFSLSMGIVLFMMFLSVFGVTNDMEGLAASCVANIMVVGSIYLWNETIRPSNENK